MNTPEEPTPTDIQPHSGESFPVQSPPRRSRWLVVGIFALVMVIIGIVLVARTMLAGSNRALYPNLPTFTPIAVNVDGELALVGFTELNENPSAFRDRRIQVSGDFASVAPNTCNPFSGPAIRWSLVSEELQLNTTGFENLMRLVSEGTPMTLSGIWRLYRGPVGCGKEPPVGNVWYLDVDRIIEPNPLFGSNGAVLTVVAGSPLPTLPPLELSPPTTEATPTLTATLELSPTADLPATALIPLPTQVAPSATFADTTPLPTTTADPFGTPALTATPGPSPTTTATGSADGTVTPGIPTATLSGTGYPGQATNTPTGYP